MDVMVFHMVLIGFNGDLMGSYEKKTVFDWDVMVFDAVVPVIFMVYAGRCKRTTTKIATIHCMSFCLF